MAKKTAFKVTHPDGTVSTRTSARPYTFVVVSVPATQEARRTALNKRADELVQRAAQMVAAADAGIMTRRDRGLRMSAEDFNAFDVMLKGTEVRTGRVTYCEISNRANNHSLSETWRRYVPEGVEVVRETTADTSGELKVAVDARAYLIGRARERAAELLAHADQYRADAELPDPDGFGVVRWSSRRDLASKSFSEFDHLVAIGRTLTVVPVDPA